MPSVSMSRTLLGSVMKTTTVGSNPSSTITLQNARRKDESINRVSVSTPNFRKRVSPGGLPMNNFSFSQTEFNRLGGTVVERSNMTSAFNKWTVKTVGDMDRAPPADFLLPQLSESQISALNASAVNGLLGRLKDQKVNLVQAYAERAQVASMLSSTISTIANVVADLGMHRWDSAAKRLGVSFSRKTRAKLNRDYGRDQRKAVANAWIELQYGWSPLLGDIYGASEMLASRLDPEIREKVSCSKTMPIALNTRGIESFTPGLAYTITGEASYTIKYVCYFSLGNGMTHTLSQVGITNPLTIAWELLPWSFVVDWFLPVGNYINSLDADLGLVFEKGCKTTFYNGNVSIVLLPGGKRTTSEWIESAYVTGSKNKVSCDRVKLTQFPSSQFPSFKNPFSKAHVANSLALLTQTFKR